MNMDCSQEIGGSEGSGIIVEVGADLRDKDLKGRKVAFCHGAWSQYVVKDVDHLLFFNDNVDLRLAANAVANPLAALCLKYMLLERKAQSFIVFGAASALGRMLIKVALRKNLRPIAVVQDERELSCLEKDFDKSKLPLILLSDKERLSTLLNDLKPLYLLDLVGSEASGSLFEQMAANSELLVVGNLSNASLKLSTTEFFMHNKGVRGFNFEHHMNQLEPQRRKELMRIVEEDINSGGEYFGIRNCKEYRVEDWDQALKEKGRVLLRFQEEQQDS